MECSNLLKNCQIQTNLSSLLFKPMSLTSSCLASDGASKMLTDLLQFQIDGLHSPSSSDRIKRSCALKIFDVCSNYDNRTFLTQAGVMEVLLNTLKLLGREKDVTVRLSLVGLCWCFFSNPNVSCNQNYWIESIFPHLFASCVSSEELNANRNAKPVTDSLVHRKRKFTQKQSPQIQNTNTISDGCCSNEAIDSTDQRIIDLIQQRYSNLFRLIRGETQDIYPSVVAFERSLCLCLVSRILVTSVTCQSIYGNTTSLVSLSSKRFGASSSPRSPSNSQSSSSTSPGSTDLPDKTKDLLTVFQALLRRSTPSSSGATPQVFLSKLAISLQSQVSNIMTFLKSSNMLSLEAAENFISVQVRCDLFFLLTLLEASCFKCPENQVLLFQNGGLVSDLLALLKQLFALLLPSLAETESTHNNSETSHKSCKHILGADETEERRRMCALFPELAPATSSDSALEPNECLSTDHIRVGLSDIWLATLRLLVNAMHDSENIVTDFIDCDDSSLTTSASLAFILDVFNKLCQWRKKTKVTEVEDSPQEKLVYDSLLYLCTLLGNIAESSPDRKSAIATLVISNLNSEAGSEQSLVEYLAQLVQTEAAPFLNDLRETDGVLRQSTATSAAVTEVTPDSKVGDILNPASSSIVLTSPGHANRVDATGHSSNEKLPVSEIILASHASLLLFSLTHDWLAEETENMVTGPVADSKVALQQKATACLPDGNWWLPLRVLKASLSLQSQTGMLFADSAGPLTATIIAMEAANRAYAVTASPVKVEDTPQGSASSSSTSLGHDFSQESVYKRESLSITDDAEDDWIRAIMESSNSQASPVQAQVKIATCKVASSSETTTDLIAVTSFSSITTKPVVTVASPEKIIMTSDTETATLTATAIATASTLVNTAIMNITDSYIDEDSWLVEETRLLPSVKLAKRKYGTQPLLSLAKRFSH